MKKRLFAILILALAMVLALTSCDFFQDIMDKINPSDEEYTVYFITGDGATYVPNQSVKKGELVTKPENPTRDGFDFDNWYKDEALTVVWNFETDKVTNHTMIYAKWNEHFHEGGEATCESGPICTKCGKEYGEALGHKGGTATCTEAAVCEVCGESYGEPLGHKGGEANCLVGPSCDVCGITYTDPLGHDAKDPTCTEASVCDRCGKTLAEALGHIDEDADYVCDRCEEPLEVPVEKTTIMLEITDADLTSYQGPQTVRIGEFEIILSSEKSRIESSSAKFMVNDEEVKKNYRINFNGDENGYDPATGKWQNAIMFKASGKGSVTIWWYHAGKGSDGDTSAKAYRNVALYDDQGNILAQTNEQYTYKATIITTFEFDAAGTYYISNIAGANNFYYVEVSYEGELVKLPELPELPKYNVHFNTGEGSAVNSLQVEENARVEKPEDPTREGFDFAGWYKDEECTTPWNFGTDRITSDTVLYAKWEATYVGEYEDVYYAVDISTLETGTRSEDEIAGKFTILSGTEVRNRTKTWTNPDDSADTKEFTKSVKLGSSTSAIKVSVPGTGKLTFYVQNGSSGADMQFVKVTSPDGTISQIEFVGNASGSPVVQIVVDVTEGDWLIERVSGTVDVFMLELACSVPVSAETGFEIVSPGVVDYVAGDDLDLSRLVLNATFESGKTEPIALADVTVDSSEFNKDVAGTYTIKVSYKDYAPLTYTVNVYAPTSIRLDFDAVEKTGQTAYGNGLYFNHSFKEVYSINEELATAGLSVTVICTNPAGGNKEFKVALDEVTITGFNSSVAGTQTLTVSFGDIKATVDVHVVDTAPSKVDGAYQAKVDKAYTGAIGAVVDGYNMFTTIQQALDYLASREEITGADKKLIVIGEGLFTEKLEITIPNLTIKGAGKDKTMIEWDSLYGIVDAGGFTHTTDSTQTVAVRDTAPGCTISDLTISNAYNSKEYFDKTMGENYGEHRALALLVQSDRFIMKDAALLGYQDTVEFFTGRQYLSNVYIQGLTDFIFGTNNTTLFENCQIHSIDVGKTDGGYITAFKGMNKGSADAVQYGAIFYKCSFTADEATVANGNTAIGRPWGAYAAVAVIECEIAGHVSTKGSSGASKNERYVIMSGVKPTDETVKFVEFGNTGAGAITEAVAGMRMLTAEEAALYHDISTIFGTINGGVGYLDPWDPHSTEVVVDDRTYYYFDQGNSATGTSNTFDTTTTIAKGETLDWAGLHISAENGNVAWNQNANALNMKKGAFITFEVPAGSIVTITTYTGYNYFTLNGVGTANSSMLAQYYAEATTVTLLSTGDLYLYSIIIDPNAEAPEAPTLSEIKVEGMNPNYKLGDELSYEGVTVKAIYSDSSIRFLSASDCEIDISSVDVSAEGEYSVVFTYGGKSATVTVNYEDPDAAVEITKNTTLSFKTEADYALVQNNKRVTMEGSFRFNGAEYQIKGTISFPVKAGTVVVVNPYNNSEYVSYTIGKAGEENLATLSSMHIYTAEEDCTVVYTGLSNNYLVSIDIICPSANTTYVFGGAAIEGDHVGVLSSTGNLIVEGKDMRNNGDSAQMYQENKIKFAAPGKSTVTITGHSKGYGQLTILVNGNLHNVESDDNGVYVIKLDGAALITILPKNVGTEEEPAYNKSYIKAIKVETPVIISETTTIDLSATGANIQGTTGTYEGLNVDATTGKFADNGGGWVQVNQGTIITLYVLADAEVSITPYSSVDNFTIVTEGGVCTITVIGNDYLKAISVVYPHVYEEPTTIDLSATGANIQGGTGSYEGLNVDATTGKFADNGSGWVQVNTGTVITLNVFEGAVVSVTAYSSADSFTVVVENGVCTITAVANDYLKAIVIEAPVPAHECEHKCEECGKCLDAECAEDVCAEKCEGHEVIFSSSTTIDLSATGAKIEGTTGSYKGLEIDATSGKFSDNGSGWVQVNQGTVITLKIAGDAEVSVTAYSSAENFTVVVADGVCTITATANDYLKAITIKIVHVYAEPTTIDLSATGANIQGGKGVYEGLEVDATNGKFADNNGGWTQVNTGTIIRLNVLDGAVVSVTAYSSADNFTVVVENGVCTITAVGNDYLKAITVNYPIVYTEPTTIDLSATGANIQDGTGVYEGLEVDATTGKFADNNGGWVQVNTGTVITLNVFEGAVVSVSAYSSADNFTVVVEGGVCTITAVGNDYLNAITIAEAPAEPEEVTYVLDATADLEAFAKNTKTDGETQVLHDFFTLHYSANTKVDSSNKSWDDGYSATQRINFGGKMQVGSTTKQCVEFTVTAGATVKIWWVSGGDDRPMTIWNSDKEVVAQDTNSVKDGIYISTLEITEAGTYYLGGDVNNNYIFKIEVTTTK